MFELSDTQLKFIGEGIKGPPLLSARTGGFSTNKGFDRIDQSINTILRTPIGSRAGNREFGSKLHNLVFETNDFIFQDLAKVYIKEALKEWEPRIDVVDIQSVTSDEDYDNNRCNFNIQYRIRNTNIVNNYVFVPGNS